MWCRIDYIQQVRVQGIKDKGFGCSHAKGVRSNSLPFEAAGKEEERPHLMRRNSYGEMFNLH